MFSKSIIAASLVSAVSAHQNFHQFWVNDVTPGYQVAIRMPPSNSPVTDVTSDDITCNVNGNNLTLSALVSTAAASAGDNITVQWDSSSHPGPIQHFLFGPVTNASQATGIGSWVKIDEFVEENGTWANAIMEANDMKYSFNLPTDLASGDYLLRSEMLALHGSQTLGGGQFYIGCAQLTITGTAGDSCSPEIQLPGAYNESDPSIYIPNFYNGFNISTYTPPGGAVATCGTGSGSASAAATSVIASTTSSAVAVATSSAISTSAAPQTTSSASLIAQVGIASTSSSSLTIASTTAASSSAASSAIASPTSTAAVSAVEMPSGTTLGNLLSWVSSFYSANSDSEYTGSTIARRHARDVVKN